MYISSNKAFSLIELLVVITIIGIISLAIYFPYAHHQKRTLVNQWVSELSQSLNSARNMAIQWRSTWSWNLHIWLFFPDEKTVRFNGYPLSATWSLTSWEILSKRTLPRWVTLSWSLVGVEYFFEAINWDLSKRELQDDNFALISHEDKEVLEISFKRSTSDNLRRNLYYYTRSHITDF